MTTEYFIPVLSIGSVLLLLAVVFILLIIQIKNNQAHLEASFCRYHLVSEIKLMFIRKQFKDPDKVLSKLIERRNDFAQLMKKEKEYKNLVDLYDEIIETCNNL